MQMTAECNSGHLSTYWTFEWVTCRDRTRYWYTWSPKQVQIRHRHVVSSCFLSEKVHAGVMIQRVFPWHILGLSIQIEDHCKATVYLSIVADKVHPFTVTRCTFSTIMHRVTKHSSSQDGSRDMAMTSANARFHSFQTSTQLESVLTSSSHVYLIKGLLSVLQTWYFKVF